MSCGRPALPTRQELKLCEPGSSGEAGSQRRHSPRVLGAQLSVQDGSRHIPRLRIPKLPRPGTPRTFASGTRLACVSCAHLAGKASSTVTQQGGPELTDRLRREAHPPSKPPLIQQSNDGVQQSGLTLAPLPQQHEVVASKQCSLGLWDNGVLEPMQATARVKESTQISEQVLANFGPDRDQLVPTRT